jgi:hypothetical protein
MYKWAKIIEQNDRQILITKQYDEEKDEFPLGFEARTMGG